MIRQGNTLFLLLIVLFMSILMTGCLSSHSGNKLYFNREQAIVMEPSVLAAGVVAGKPQLERYTKGTQATVTLSNTQSYPVSIRYRFYWYNEQGLEISPAGRVNDVLVPGDGDTKISADIPNQTISYVRVYLFI
ncbi:YcfL family protein [Proteus myxofaciens]|uniref:YcfL family salvage pathway lipoprotein n=1 Tax=Proteus myxofaciens ATCC 19692 TaxID=1354337 RepID=A0A198FE40_9GAMM|nr:YcfL family protein [Proteus myxofaciens]OAT22536.1 YcfL family salvage pathway lipoprotein [Proteus myxofaciens ATCC 19692]